MQTDLRLAHSLLMNIRDREAGARRVGRTAELAGNHHALNGPRRAPEGARDLDRRAREVARESIRVEHDAMVLGDHVDVLRQGTVSDENRPFLYANHMPRAIEVRSQRARNLVQVQGSKRGSGAGQSDASCADQDEEQAHQNDEETDPGIREPVPDLRKGEKWQHACLPSRTDGYAMRPSGPCHICGSKQKRRQCVATTGSRLQGYQ